MDHVNTFIAEAARLHDLSALSVLAEWADAETVRYPALLEFAGAPACLHTDYASAMRLGIKVCWADLVRWCQLRGATLSPRRIMKIQVGHGRDARVIAEMLAAIHPGYALKALPQVGVPMLEWMQTNKCLDFSAVSARLDQVMVSRIRDECIEWMQKISV